MEFEEERCTRLWHVEHALKAVGQVLLRGRALPEC